MRILLLHGYAQNKDTFNIKARRLERRILRMYPDATLCWAEGPIQLRTDDIAEEPEKRSDWDTEQLLNFRAWYYTRQAGRSPRGFYESLEYLAGIVRKFGPFDGVIGFSQGAVMAIFLASLLEGESRFGSYQRHQRYARTTLPYPAAFHDLEHPPLKFAVLFCPGLEREHSVSWLLEDPMPATPFYSCIGETDIFVTDQQRTFALETTRNKDSIEMMHAGGHHIPPSYVHLDCVLSFLTTSVYGKTGVYSDLDHDVGGEQYERDRKDSAVLGVC